jgi:pilus assembly protein Flp/PilA
MLKFIRQFFEKTEGATAIEYALIASLIAVACIAGFQNLGTTLSGSMDNVTNNIDATGQGSNDEQAADAAAKLESTVDNAAGNVSK